MTRTYTSTAAVGAVVGVFILVRVAQESADQLRLPVGLLERFAYIPQDNPLASDKITLGKQIFWDRRWSKSHTVACVSCHQPEHGWSDPRQFSLDHAGKPTIRHAPTIINRLFSTAQGWPGHRKSLEELLYHLPFTSPETIAQNLGHQGYQEQFQRVFNTAVTAEGVAKALAVYTRTILSGGNTNPWLSSKSRPLHLTVQEQADLVAFLHALTGEIATAVSSPPQLPP